MKSIYFILLFLLPILLFAQIEEPDRTNIRPVDKGYYINPQSTNLGIFLTDEKSQNLFIIKAEDTIPQPFLDYSADFKNYSISPDEKNIGFKKLKDGITYLIKYNIDSRKLAEVFFSKGYCSNLSFSTNNLVAFSVNDIAYVVSEKDTNKYQQVEKIIDIAISPDGSKLAILNKKGKINIIKTSNGKKIANISGYCTYLRWSPDSRKLAYIRNVEINVWNSNTKSGSNLGEGTRPQWSQDSKYIIFQKNTPIELKFVNADLYISSFDAKEVHQITNTTNLFEMQPIFISSSEILYLTYEDRQIFRAGLREYKLENEKVLFKVVK